MHVAVAIVGFRNPADIEACIEALSHSTHVDFEVVICENGGPQAFSTLQTRTPEALAGGQAVKLIAAPGNLGYAGGVNVCLAAAPDADAWWVLNPDTMPSEGAMAGLVARLARGDCDAAGCAIVLPEGVVGAFGGRWQTLLGRAVSLGRGSRDLSEDQAVIEREQNYLHGASMMISRRFLACVGPMREDYFLYCEEVEWCLRAARRGMRLGFAPGSAVRHTQGTTMGEYHDIQKRSKLPVYLTERNRILLTLDLFPWLAPVVVALTLPLLIAKFGRRGAWKQVGFGIQGALAALRNERGPPAFMGPQGYS
jgi:GT2 family glycosyltransferase